MVFKKHAFVLNLVLLELWLLTLPQWSSGLKPAQATEL